MEKIYIHKMNKELMLREESEIVRLLPDWRKKKVEKFKVESGRLESIAAGRLLDIALSDFLGASRVVWREEDFVGADWLHKCMTEIVPESDEVKLCKVEDDSLESCDAASQIVYFNISHSGDYVMAAVSDRPIGVDVEFKEDKDFRVTKRMFSDGEREYIGDNQKRFRDVWTVKEAFLKCTGDGIVVPLNSFTTDYNRKRVQKIVSTGYKMENKEYYVRTERIDGENYSFSVCSENPNLILDTREVEVLI